MEAKLKGDACMAPWVCYFHLFSCTQFFGRSSSLLKIRVVEVFRVSEVENEDGAIGVEAKLKGDACMAPWVCYFHLFSCTQFFGRSSSLLNIRVVEVFLASGVENEDGAIGVEAKLKGDACMAPWVCYFHLFSCTQFFGRSSSLLKIRVMEVFRASEVENEDGAIGVEAKLKVGDACMAPWVCYFYLFSCTQFFGWSSSLLKIRVVEVFRASEVENEDGAIGVEAKLKGDACMAPWVCYFHLFSCTQFFGRSSSLLKIRVVEVFLASEVENEYGAIGVEAKLKVGDACMAPYGIDSYPGIIKCVSCM